MDSQCELLVLSSSDDEDMINKTPGTVKRKPQLPSNYATVFNTLQCTSHLSYDDEEPLLRVEISKPSASIESTTARSSTAIVPKSSELCPFEDSSGSEDEFDRLLFGDKSNRSNGFSPHEQPKRSRTEDTEKSGISSDFHIEPLDNTPGNQRNSSRHLHPMSDSDSEGAAAVPMSNSNHVEPKKKAVEAKDTQQSPKKQGRRGKYTAEEKAAIEAEKQVKRRQREEMKRKRPENCVKFIIMEVDRGLVDIQALQAVLHAPPINDIRQEVKRRSIPFSVSWYRETLPDENGECGKEATTAMMQLLEMHSVEPLVKDQQLAVHIKTILKANRLMERFTLIIFGSRQYFSVKRKKNDGRISKSDLEEAIVDCQIDLGVSFRLLENAQEVCEWLFRYTKAVANEPYKSIKKSWQENFRFDLASEKSNNIRDSFPNVWLKTLKKFRRAPLEMCQAIASLYPSPHALILAYEKCSTVEEAKSLLENIMVTKDIGPVSTQRRVGPALSRRLHAVLTSVQPDLLLSELG